MTIAVKYPRLGKVGHRPSTVYMRLNSVTCFEESYVSPRVDTVTNPPKGKV